MSVIPPPPSVRRSDDGCWKIGLAGCGVLLVLGIAFVAWIGWFVAKSPAVKNVVKSALQAEAALAQIKTVGRALDRYVADKKHYPKELAELVPQYLPNEASLRIYSEKDAPRIWYRKPAPDAPGETIVLQVRITPPVPMRGAPPWDIKRRKDGKLDETGYVFTDQYGRRQRIPLGDD